MATPLRSTQILQLFHSSGVSYEARLGWGTHTRTSAERPWGPVHGVMIHHTGPYTSEAQILKYLWDGTGPAGPLPGPLAHAGICKAGTVHMTGWGRCNHAGKGDPVVLDRVIAEHLPYPAPRYDNDDAGGVDGNRHFYGFELINRGDGKDPWPEEQLAGAARAAAAICRYHGWTERSVIGHKEWQRGKIDPTFSMTDFRKRVAKLL